MGRKTTYVLKDELDEGDRERIVATMPLAKSLASKYRTRRATRDQIFSAAYWGLIEAALRYDPSKGEFGTYAHSYIRLHMQQAKVENAVVYSGIKDVNNIKGVSDETMEKTLSARGPAQCDPIVWHRLPSRDDGGISGIASRDLFERLISGLDLRSASILRMVYVQDMSYSEIGQEIGVNKERIRQIVSRSLERLRARWDDSRENLYECAS